MRARTTPRFLAFVVLVFLLVVPAFAADAQKSSPTIDRLAHAGRLWGTVRYLHPYLLYRDIDWDAALVAALPRIEAAKSPEEYGAAVQGMLAALGDPATRVVSQERQEKQESPEEKPAAAPGTITRKLDDGTLVVALAQGAVTLGNTAFFNAVNAASAEVSPAPAVIVDLRGGGPEGVMGELFGVALDQMSYSLVARPCRAPSQRYVLRSGYRSQRGGSQSYSAGFYLLAADSYDPGLLPAERRPAAKRIVFLVDRAAHLPAVALALQSAGDARIVATAPLGDDAVAATDRIDLGEGISARVRVSEVVPDAEFPGIHADVELPAGTTPEQALQAAAAELHKDGWGTPRQGAPAPLPGPVFRLDATYPGMTEPDLPHRQLAVIRAWNVIHYFYPYLHLIGDWDAVLPEFLAKMEKAGTGRDYALTIAEMMTHVPDGHTTLYGHPELAKYFGMAGLPLGVRWIEGMAVVVHAGSDEAKQAGIVPGDTIVAVDGETVPDRLKRLARYVSASSPEILNAKLCSQYLLRGPAGPAVLSIQGADGKTREVHLTRDPKFRFFEAEETGETVRVLPGNWGYADLRRLTIQEVDGLFEKVKDTRGLILDMRGYPQGTAWSIAPRINTKGAKIGAQFRRAQVMAFSAEEGDSGFYFNQALPPLPAGKPLYTRPVVMLIDDRAISQSEHSGLFYEAANSTKFIGAPTAGANGDVTQLSLPGGMYVVFTGHDVRHADGRQLQRIGLQPDIPAAPTRAGIRAGKDEVLERAVRYLEEQSGGGKP